jgi:DDE_Tnp_1-associated
MNAGAPQSKRDDETAASPPATFPSTQTPKFNQTLIIGQSHQKEAPYLWLLRMYFWEQGWEKLGIPDTHSLSHHFRQLEDPRVERRRVYSLHDILLISLCALLCGAESFVDIEDFGHAQHEWLSQLVELPGGIPIYDTFGRGFAALDPDQFAKPLPSGPKGCARAWPARSWPLMAKAAQ